MKYYDYRATLKEELQARKKGNRNYSLRALSRDLDLSSAYLSQVMQGRRNLSLEKAEVLAVKLQLGPKEKELFLKSVQLATAKSDARKLSLQKELVSRGKKSKDHLSLKLNQFQKMSDWHYSAILVLCYLKEKRTSPDWFAKKLGVKKDLVKQALDVLMELGLLEKAGDDFVPVAENVSQVSLPSSALRKNHKQFLQMAEGALHSQEFLKYDISGSVFSIHPRRLPELRQTIQDFRKQMLELSNQDEDADQIYRLSVQLFRLDRDLEE